MNLQERMQSFVGWMKSNTLKGFRSYTEETYSDDYNSLENVLLSIAANMKTAVKFNHAEEYLSAENLYKSYFIVINQDLAKNHYDELMEEISDSGLTDLDRQIMVVTELWKHPLYRKYLDVTVKMSHPKTGELLYLVGCHEHARGRRPYVIAEEIEMLKNSFQDPWEYVRNREVKIESTQMRTHS